MYFSAFVRELGAFELSQYNFDISDNTLQLCCMYYYKTTCSLLYIVELK